MSKINGKRPRSTAAGKVWVQVTRLWSNELGQDLCQPLMLRRERILGFGSAGHSPDGLSHVARDGGFVVLIGGDEIQVAETVEQLAQLVFGPADVLKHLRRQPETGEAEADAEPSPSSDAEA